VNEKEACVALNLIPKLGPVRIHRLLEAFGSAEAVLRARRAELRAVPGVGEEVAGHIAQWESTVDLPAELARVAEFGAGLLTLHDPLYPPLLREIHNAPIVLYVYGRLTEADHRAISVVGSRKTTHYGVESARKLAYQLAYAGLTVVSGLARGIDTAAHMGALAAKGRTVAVLGSGLLSLYPPENRELAEKIAGQGAIVSEFPMLTSPSVQTFPQRNRIVSGWSEGLLVIEAGLKSGALITAGQAADQGRTLYVVPGQIDRPNSAGSNRLIQQGARLVTAASDILEEMRFMGEAPPENAPARELPFTDAERAVYDAIDETETKIDRIAEKSRLPPAVVSSTLLALEFKRFVKQLPGQYYVKLS